MIGLWGVFITCWNTCGLDVIYYIFVYIVVHLLKIRVKLSIHYTFQIFHYIHPRPDVCLCLQTNAKRNLPKSHKEKERTELLNTLYFDDLF